MGNIYVGANDVARKIKGAYVGVDGVARKVKQIYVGVNGVARLVWQSIPSVLYFFSRDQNFTSIQNCNVAKQQLNGGIYNGINMHPTKTMVTYLYLNGVQWSKYSKLTITYASKNIQTAIGNRPDTESSSNSIGTIFQNTTTTNTVTYNINMTDNEYLVINTIASSQYDPTDFTFMIYELYVSQ